VEGSRAGNGNAASPNSPIANARYYAKARHYGGGRGSFLSVDPWQGDATNPLSYNKHLYGYANPGSYVDPDGRQSVDINVMSCSEVGSCGMSPMTASALPYLSPSAMATPQQSEALLESQARYRFVGRTDSPLVVQPLVATGAARLPGQQIEYGSSRQLSAMQSSAELDRALGAEPNYIPYARGTEAAGGMVVGSLPPVAIANGVRTMATAEDGWQFAGGALETVAGATPLGLMARAEISALRTERVAAWATQQGRPLVVAEGGVSEVRLVLQYKPHGDLDEFARQLALQDEGFANATAGEIRARIERYRAKGRPSEATTAAREARRQNPLGASGNAALHAPDCCIGGDPTKIVGFGGVPENSSIGAQNKYLQTQVYEAVTDAPADARMLVRSLADDELP